MTGWVDYAILAILGASALISVVRGLAREVLSLAGWIAAIWLGLAWGPAMARALTPWVQVEAVRLAAGFLLVFLATLVAAGVTAFLVGRLLARTGLGATDRLLGALFGLARGALVITLLVLAAGTTGLPGAPWWQESALLGHFQELALQVRGHLPPDLAARVRF